MVELGGLDWSWVEIGVVSSIQSCTDSLPTGGAKQPEDGPLAAHPGLGAAGVRSVEPGRCVFRRDDSD
jgi:hypothetical protein